MSNTTWKKDCQKILDVFTADKNASPFLAPVPWKEYGLYDYPQIVKVSFICIYPRIYVYIYIYISINKYTLSYLQTCMYNPHSSYETNPLLLLLLLYIYSIQWILEQSKRN